MKTLKIIINGCKDCPFMRTLWYSKEPTYECDNMHVDRAHGVYGREIQDITQIDPSCTLKEEENWDINKSRD